MRKLKRKSLINKLDRLASIVARSKGRCEACKKFLPTGRLNPHHFYSRSNQTIRWDGDNLFCLCAGCHTLSNKFSAHKTPADFVEWAREKRGEAWYKRIRAKANSIKQWSDNELIELIKKHEAKIKL